MIGRKHFWLSILTYCLIGLSTFLMQADPKMISGDATENLSPTLLVMESYAERSHDGDWIVTGAEAIENDTIILNGNLIIEPGASLTLTNVTLLFEQKLQDMYQILAKPSSSLVISNSTIAASQRDYRFAFIVQGAHFMLKQSKLEGLGRPSGYTPGGGLLINNTNTTILEGNIINHHESYGVTLSNSTNATISNNTITCTGPDETSRGITLDNSHNNTITYNHLYRQWDPIHLQSSWDNYIAHNELTLTSHSIGISIWYGSGNNVIEYNNISVHEGYDNNT
jgi:parallel beta-helix repeat protein